MTVVAGMQEEVAEAYNIAVITFRGLNAITNFDMSPTTPRASLTAPSSPSATVPSDGAKDAKV
uniref:AP2/ERF domain-containing protein n=1 Tax=Oryza glumipatula TaxID=40148 RepID=A0A0D9Z9R8_9ORYZ